VSGCAEKFDQVVGVSGGAFAGARDGIEVFVRVLLGADRGGVTDGTEHQVRGDRRRVGVPHVRRDQLGGEASCG
jgi:hypothetical protein